MICSGRMLGYWLPAINGTLVDNKRRTAYIYRNKPRNRPMRTLILASVVFIATGAYAQNDRDAVSMESRVRSEVSALTESLGLNEKQAAEVENRMMRAEKEAYEFRVQCDKAQTQIDAIMDRSYASMGDILDPEQSNKLAEMRKSGQLNSGCSHGAEAKSCSDKGTAKTGACCAGGKAHAAPATKEAPAKTKNSLNAN